ncbi:hypothetical protein JDV09_00730 [Mycobacterium sp. Y57]|uniref:hypothetical protein n=1 Tax=Mycolicibacterium xanthum TaxID=2796469 RepID=UPI001C85C0C4|nr:hypothetical protein [Mycolicibacterium xanthum]MBX7430639.1 hypothetical protein [Mycolicibacterium xanthum]
MTNWISRLAQRLADVYYLPSVDSLAGDHDADARRIRGELDAIRLHLREHG